MVTVPYIKSLRSNLEYIPDKGQICLTGGYLDMQIFVSTVIYRHKLFLFSAGHHQMSLEDIAQYNISDPPECNSYQVIWPYEEYLDRVMFSAYLLYSDCDIDIETEYKRLTRTDDVYHLAGNDSIYVNPVFVYFRDGWYMAVNLNAYRSNEFESITYVEYSCTKETSNVCNIL